jgi:hypothetical protein
MQQVRFFSTQFFFQMQMDNSVPMLVLSVQQPRTENGLQMLPVLRMGWQGPL